MLHSKLFFILFLFFITSCNSVFYHPDADIRITPDKFNLKYKEISIETEDGEKLNGWHIFSKNKVPYATILHFHGNAENISTQFMYIAWLSNMGFDIIEFDYRGYGSSTGKPSRHGLYIDSIAALNWTKNNTKTKDVFIVAQSLGGAVAIPAYTANPISNVKAIILDSTFASYRKITREKLSSVHVPLLFLHSKNDPVVPYDTGNALFLEASEPKEFWDVIFNRHCYALIGVDDRYRKKLVNYFCNHLSDTNNNCKVSEVFASSKESPNYINVIP